MSTLSVLAFDNESEAERVASELKKLQEQNLIKIDDAAILTRRPDGKPKIKQAHNLVAAGALGGAFWGMLIGLLFFMPFLGAAIGAGFGAMGGSMADLGIDDKFIKSINDEIQPGQAALFLLTEQAVMDKVTEAMKPYKFRLIHTSLSKEDESKLRETLGLTQ
jgi:uncharacterized membrane protein